MKKNTHYLLHFVCFTALLQLLFQVANRAKMHGIGRHNSEEIHKIGCDDIQAISTYLGTKPYLMGDIPTIVSSITLNLNLFEFLILVSSFFRKRLICNRVSLIQKLIFV